MASAYNDAWSCAARQGLEHGSATRPCFSQSLHIDNQSIMRENKIRKADSKNAARCMAKHRQEETPTQHAANADAARCKRRRRQERRTAPLASSSSEAQDSDTQHVWHFAIAKPFFTDRTQFNLWRYTSQPLVARIMSGAFA